MLLGPMTVPFRKKTDGRTDRQTDRRTDGRTDRQTQKDRQTDRQTDRSGSSYLKDVNGGLVDGAHYCTACIDCVTHCPHDNSSSPGVQPCTTSAYVNQSINQSTQGLRLKFQVRVVMCVCVCVCNSYEQSSLPSRKVCRVGRLTGT